MKHTTRLSYLMVLSWEIQRKKKRNRSKSLQAAWAITLNEDITIYYLVKGILIIAILTRFRLNILLYSVHIKQ